MCNVLGSHFVTPRESTARIRRAGIYGSFVRRVACSQVGQREADAPKVGDVLGHYSGTRYEALANVQLLLHTMPTFLFECCTRYEYAESLEHWLSSTWFHRLEI